MISSIICFVAFLIIAAGPAGAQSRTITGTVSDAETGDSLPGVNVVVSNSNTGTSTNQNGEYSLSVSANADSLVFTFVGFQR